MISSPKSGDSFIFGEKVQIRWISPNRYPAESPYNKVNIWLNSQNAVGWSITSLGHNVQDTGSFDWDTGSYTLKPGEQMYYNIQVITVDKVDGDDSDTFIIYPNKQSAQRHDLIKTSTETRAQLAQAAAQVILPTPVTITSPKKGDMFSPGDTIPISWTPSGKYDKMCLAFFGESATNSHIICDIPDTGLFKWRYTLPDVTPQRQEEQFKITLYHSPTPSSAVFITDSEPFSLRSEPFQDYNAGIIGVYKPYSGESIAKNDPIDIRWTREFNVPIYDKVIILLCSKDGTILKTLHGSAENTGYYSCNMECHLFWPLPNVNTKDLYIEVSTADGKFKGKSASFTFT